MYSNDENTQCTHITSSHRPKSSLTRGQSRLSSRPGTANAASIEEGDENAPLPPTPPPEEPPQPPQTLKVEEPPPEPPKEVRMKDFYVFLFRYLEM